MEIFIWAFIGGIFGAVLMDITETYSAKLGITSGVNIALVGRWFLGLLRGKFVYTNISEAKSVAHEVKAGWLFHLLIGGGGVALLYPLFLLSAGFGFSVSHVWWGMLFGLVTSILPWFILLPSFGWGWFGRRGPQGSNALLASILSHIPYGLGVGLIINLFQ